MSRKRRESNISHVEFLYVGTDEQFNIFLSAIVHDYLTVARPDPPKHEELVQSVESRTA